jgi:hypothetical protein
MPEFGKCVIGGGLCLQPAATKLTANPNASKLNLIGFMFELFSCQSERGLVSLVPPIFIWAALKE